MEFLLVILRILFLFNALSDAVLHFVAIGDWGTGRREQLEVADVMNSYCGNVGGCAFIMSLGDNFYDDNIHFPDKKFETHWRDVYTGEHIKDLVWYISVGNHDHASTNGELQQVEFGKNESRWHFPWLWYDFYHNAGQSNVHFIAVDTESLLTSKHNVTAQREFINSTIENSEGDWIVVFGHHPMYSVGQYYGYSGIQRDIQYIMEEKGAQLYMCGHDHNMQHIVRNESLSFDHVVTGAGGRGLYDYRAFNERWINNQGWKVDCFAKLHGFTAVTIDTNKLTIDHYTYEVDDISGKFIYVLMYSFTRERSDYNPFN